jgi:hypothetical protein
MFGKGAKVMFGGSELNPSDIYNEIGNKIKSLYSAEDREKYTSELIDKINNEDIIKSGVSDFDKIEIKKALDENQIKKK